MDEIGDMPAAMQAKLLRVLENGEVVRLGSNEPIEVDVRLISATNRKLDEMVAEKQFREDLFFRIKGVTLSLPPLRERREDIPLLIHYFLKEFAEKYQKAMEGVAPAAQQMLMSYAWPGNVRQLRTAIENMVVLSPGTILDRRNAAGGNSARRRRDRTPGRNEQPRRHQHRAGGKGTDPQYAENGGWQPRAGR